MPINFLPNDPDDTVMPIRRVTPRAARASNRADFTFSGAVAEGQFDPTTQTAQFLFWQCREGALAALEAWEAATGAPFKSWQSGRRIDLIPDEGAEANAFYNRFSLSFFHFKTGAETFFSGASTDVVAHEAGHGILDAIRPALFGSDTLEVNAAHEGFGDCVAILTALHDKPTRDAVLADIGKKNFVEGTAENLSRAIKEGIANGDLPKRVINAAAARRAKNNFQWQLPSTLPFSGSPQDGPGLLINEAHSFGQIFSGCFYDSILNIFAALGGSTSAQLLTAAQKAATLLGQAMAVAPIGPRFFREVGRAMVKVEDDTNGGTHREEIKQAFESHNVTLGVGAMLAPVAALAGAAPKVGVEKATLSASVKKDLLTRIQGTGKLLTQAFHLGQQAVAHVVHKREVLCDQLDKRLKGVIASTQESVLVGDSGGQAAVLGALPDAVSTEEEVLTYVESLVKRGAIDFGNQVGAVAGSSPLGTTYKIKKVGGKKKLVRFRYACPGW